MTGKPLKGWTVSLDLWGTLIDHTDKAAVANWRITEFGRVFAAFGYDRTAEQVRAAVTANDQTVLSRQRQLGEQPVLEEMLAAILAPLDIPAAGEMLPVLAVVHTHAALRGCPQPLAGGVAALAALADTGARLVLTSNTLATSPAVHRDLLDDLGLSRFFDDMLFSGDLGVAKPHPKVFATIAERAQCPPQRICHVGDDHRTDITGALAAGCRAVHYRPAGRTPTGAAVIADLGQLVDAITAVSKQPCPTDSEPT
ncbi:HAD family hydrolase [Actinoplanes philippinensis]|uniref:HAD family hydrolase n=1 Tax=Actinoplanes philippinensis TaxID=35752 RepID=UPI0033C57AB5